MVFLALPLVLLHFHELFIVMMFIGFLESNLAVALLLLVLLLTCGMMALKIKSGRGAGREGAARTLGFEMLRDT